MTFLLWLIIGGGLLVVQMLSGWMDLLFVALAAGLTALLCALFPAFANLVVVQIVSWVVLSFFSVLFFRRRFKKTFVAKNTSQDSAISDLVGRQAQVIEDIRPPSEGRVSLDGTSWAAVSNDTTISAGTTVFVHTHDNLLLEVSTRPLDHYSSSK